VSDPVKNGKQTGERWAKLAARAVVDPTLTDACVRVLAVIGIHAGPEGIAWPSQQTIGMMVGLNRSTVCRHLKRLRERGYLDRYRKRTTRGHYRNVYRLLYPAYAALPDATAAEAASSNVIPASHRM
jgi:DNA-binding IclR family transcriptional regulator